MGGGEHGVHLLCHLDRNLSFDILIRGLVSGGVLFSETLLGGVRRATLGPAPGVGTLLTAGLKAVVPPRSYFLLV